MEDRLTCEEVHNLKINYLEIPNELKDGWIRLGITVDGKYGIDTNKRTADHRVFDIKKNKEVWSYYNDFYRG